MTDANKPTARIIACPGCGERVRYDAKNPHRPFCSPRCKNDDIVQWAEESHRLPGPPADPDEVIAALERQQDRDRD